jgi:hypothetical protein
MKLQRNPNAWSCLPTATAMVLDVNKWTVIKHIGHNGSEIKNPSLPKPQCLRGFHPQEIIDVAWQYGIAVIPIQPLPYSTPGIVIGSPAKDFVIDFKINHEERFMAYLKNTHGVITGAINKGHNMMWNGTGHAVAWDGEKCYDPRGRVCDFDDLRMDIDCYWLFQEIKSI